MSLYSLKGFKASVGWKRWRQMDTAGEERQITILTHNFFSWPYHAVLSSRPHLTLLLLLGRGYSTGGTLWAALYDTAPAERPATCLRPPCLTASLLAVSWYWLKSERISRGHLYISFHNAHTFPLNHKTASAYLQRGIPYREICDWWLGQGSIYNKPNEIIYFNIYISIKRIY